MKQQIKAMLIIVGASVALIATVFSAFATGPGLRRSPLAFPAADAPQIGEAAPLAACTKMSGGAVAWVTLTEDGQIDQQVDSYESGTSQITPVFQYNCVPKQVTIVTIFSLNGEPVFSDKESLKAANTKGMYGYPLGTTDNSPLDDGDWGVEFYNNKTLLTSGTVTVGEGTAPASTSVTVEGTIADKKTKKPIKGAVVLVLKPGVTVQQWVKGGQKDKDVLTGGKSDSKGAFALENPLERETEYSIVVVAKGYKPLASDAFSISADQEDPVQLNIKMSK